MADQEQEHIEKFNELILEHRVNQLFYFHYGMLLVLLLELLLH